MSAVTDYAAAVRALAAGLAEAAARPADRVRQLAALAAAVPLPEAATGVLSGPLAAARSGAGELCRRAALVALARAVTAYQAESYEEGAAVRDMVCGLLQDEELRAADAGQDGPHAAFRDLRVAVAVDLTRRIADLAHLQTVEAGAALPALAVAHRLYGDPERGDELANYATAPNPLFLPTRFTARDR